MTGSEIAVYWLIAGILIMLAELVIPGGIALFIGLGAVLVGGLAWLGIVDGWLPMIFTWFFLSLVLIVALRGVTQRLVRATVRKDQTDEDLDAYGQIVSVAETIPANGEGRISFRGSTWVATNVHGDQDLEAGTRVRIVFRDNLAWKVEALGDDASGQA